MSQRFCFSLFALILLAGCAGTQRPDGRALPEAGSAMRSARPENGLIGTWVRPIASRPESMEGFRFDGDGRFGLIGIHTMAGLEWRLEGDTLVLITNTNRYPEPSETRQKVIRLTAETLTLGGEPGYLDGTYRRDDSAAGRVSGTVTYRERMALPPDAFLYVTLLDVSLQDAPGKLIANQTVPTLGRQVPIPFVLSFGTADIDPRRVYLVRADIIVNQRQRFTTTTAYPVIPRGDPSGVDIVVRQSGGQQPP